jgi:hypothetical protein
VSIKLHFQVRLSVQSASYHCDWNLEISLALSTDCQCWHRADPLDDTQSALIGRHLQNMLPSQMAHHTVFSSFKLMPEAFVAEKAIRQFEDVVLGRARAKVRSLNFHMVNRRRSASDVGLEYSGGVESVAKSPMQDLRRRCLPHGVHVAVHRLSQLRIHLVRNGHDIG